MKDRLTPEQSQRLIELGVDPSKASGNTEYGAWADSEHGKPIFDLSDILSLLPKTISLHGDTCQFEIKWHCGEWIAKYDDPESCYFHSEYSFEFIDALFELLCWVLINHPDKIKKP